MKNWLTGITLTLALLMEGTAACAGAPIDEHWYVFDHADQRLCPSPMCGGLFVRQVNTPFTRCADGRWLETCYVSRLELGALGLNEGQSVRVQARFAEGAVLAQGRIGQETVLGTQVPVLRLNRAWRRAAGEQDAATPYFLVHADDASCPSGTSSRLVDERLNIVGENLIAGLDLSRTRADASQTERAERLMQGKGVVVAGHHRTTLGPNGTVRQLTAQALYLPVTGNPVAPGGMCGGIIGLGCPVGQVCDVNIPNACQGADLSGTCIVPPEVCTMEYAPVCGCDGVTYSNNCMRQASGVQLNHPGECTGVRAVEASGVPD